MPETGQRGDRMHNPQVGARVPEDIVMEVKILATRQRRRFNKLVEEALRDLLKKYRGKAKGKG